MSFHCRICVGYVLVKKNPSTCGHAPSIVFHFYSSMLDNTNTHTRTVTSASHYQKEKRTTDIQLKPDVTVYLALFLFVELPQHKVKKVKPHQGTHCDYTRLQCGFAFAFFKQLISRRHLGFVFLLLFFSCELHTAVPHLSLVSWIPLLLYTTFFSTTYTLHPGH